MSQRFRRVVGLVSSLALAAGMLSLGGGSATHAQGATVPATEAARLAAVPTPKLSWFRCYGGAECTTVRVPRDYDKPKGATVELALLRLRARNPKQRIGSLFINPGGPGGSATAVAQYAPMFLSRELLDRFDVVGMDPRGVGASDQVQCFAGLRQQEPALAGYTAAFPVTAAQEKAWLKSDRAVGKACSKNTLAKSMSTAEVARDMELMRRAVGDAKLSYLGISYGSYLGQVYANMFPTKFRAMAVDGVLDPVAWAGVKSNQDQPLEQRLRSSHGAWKALREILVRCDRVGGQRCSFAVGDPVANLAVIANRLKKQPLRVFDDFTGEEFTFSYPDLVGNLLGMLYDPAGYLYVTDMLTQLAVLTEPPSNRASAQSGGRRAALQKFNEVRRDNASRSGRPALDFYYDNSLDAFASVTCTDSKEKTKGRDYPGHAARADRQAPYFGRIWTWALSVCAGDAFTGNDEDAFIGPFTTKTANPVLFVGNHYDPATNYQAAVSGAKRLPNSRLLSSDSWGHTAYGSSDCLTSAVDRYLLQGKLPPKGKVCRGDIQPFEADFEDLASNTVRQRAMQELKGASAR